MIHLQPDLPRILFIFSDTGGGHRSAAQAIIEALQLEFPDRFDCQMVDIFRSYMPTPFKYAPEIYPPLSRMPELWELGYRASDGPRRKQLIDSATYPYISRALKRFIRENPCELFVSVHQMVNTPMLKALAGSTTPFVTVVTDMVSTHAFWYDNRATKVIVPTQAAYQRGLCMGLSPEQMEVVGMPVAERFCQPLAEKRELRRHFNWDTNMPIVLLVGGGEGMGPLAKTARAINEAQLPISLVVVTGRNRQIKAELESLSWNIPAYVYGFVTQMPEFMRAADILVTKAGPGTISEAFIAQLPMILYSKMPGQEDGNVDFVVKEEAGIWAPTPGRVVAALRHWLEHPDAREKAVESCRRLARPQASRQIARILAAQVDICYQEKVYADS